MITSRAQIVASIGPSCMQEEILTSMLQHQMDIARLNFSWGDLAQHEREIAVVRRSAQNVGRHIPIVIDLPGPRIQEEHGHTYEQSTIHALTEKDRTFITFGIAQNVEYFALSFVGNAEDVRMCKEAIRAGGGAQKVIAKIERKIAVENADQIIAETDAVMIARGDLGSEIPLEQIPFVQADLIKKCKQAGKPVITATEMMLSMVENPLPTRAEVTDVANAILHGSDAVMLSNETTVGKYPREAIAMMEKIVIEAEKHMPEGAVYNLL